jgi:uncharacterized alkaline shock family protein YloU
MTHNPVGPGKTTVAIDVLTTIARLTTLNVPGVSRMSSPSGKAVKGLFRRGQYVDGTVIEVKDDLVYADLYLVLSSEVNIRDVSRRVQYEVARAITDMVGMQVGRINVHVEDIDYSQATEA